MEIDVEMSGGGKGTKNKPKASTQSKLTDFGQHNLDQSDSKEANTATTDATRASNATSTANGEGTKDNMDSAAMSYIKDHQQLHLVKDEILGEIRNLKAEVTGRFDNVLKAIEDTRKEVTECTERLSQAEVRLSTVEDEQVDLKAVAESLQRGTKLLEKKMIDLEMRSRLNNLRLVGIPENSEGSDMCGFLENWLPDALDLNPLRSPLVLERAHRVGPRRDPDAPPRAVIMRFLNYKQKEMVFRAAKSKKDLLFKNKRVSCYVDVATEVHRQRKQFDGVREQLRQLGVRHGILSPSTLILTYKEKVHKFTSPAEANIFVKKIQTDTEETE